MTTTGAGAIVVVVVAVGTVVVTRLFVVSTRVNAIPTAIAEHEHAAHRGR